MIPNTVGIIKGCNQPELAREFLNYLLSDEVATLLAQSTSHNIPIQPNVAKHFPQLVIEDPLDVKFQEVSLRYEHQLSAVMDELSQ